jgi:hypothetical protein
MNNNLEKYFILFRLQEQIIRAEKMGHRVLVVKDFSRRGKELAEGRRWICNLWGWSNL